MRLFEKVKHTDENIYGIKQLEERDNPFEKPCVCVFLAAEGYMGSIKPINGAIKRVMEMARLTTTKSVNAGFDIDKFPVRFIGINYVHHENDNFHDFKDFATKYIEPLLIEEGHKISKEEAMRKMRNINFVSYCAGMENTSFDSKGKGLETELVSLLSKLGYEDKEITEILSQVFVMGFSSDFLDKNSRYTSVIFNDVNDDEIYFDCRQRYIEFLEKNNKKYGFVHKKAQRHYDFIINDNGEHGFKSQYLKGKAYPILISKVFSIVLNNSLENNDLNNPFRPIGDIINRDVLSRIAKIGNALENDERSQLELLKALDTPLRYYNVSRNEQEHSIAEIAEAISDVPKSLVVDALKQSVGDLHKSKEDKTSIREE